MTTEIIWFTWKYNITETRDRKREHLSSLHNCSEIDSIKPCLLFSSFDVFLYRIPLFQYRGPSLQRQHFFLKMLQLKWIFCGKESLMDRMICKKGLALFLFPHRTLCFGYLLDSLHTHWGGSNKTYIACSFNVIFLHNFSLAVTFSAKVSWH